jgi:triacylglycerol lipase
MALLAKTSTHSLNNALALAQASGLAYDDDSAAIKAGLTQAIGSQPTEFEMLDIPTHSTIVFVAGFDDAVVVSFQGTKVLANWLTDGEVRLKPFGSIGLVHEGFQEALDSVFPQLLELLGRLAGQGRTLWITGHSLGGALALLTAAYLRFPVNPTKTLPRPIAGVYTFGQPRVGTHDFCDACAANFWRYYFRYVNQQDIVTRVPPRELGYWHIDSVEYITSSGSIEEDPAWWQVFLDQVQVGLTAMEGLKLDRPFVDLVADHSSRSPPFARAEPG